MRQGSGSAFDLWGPPDFLRGIGTGGRSYSVRLGEEVGEPHRGGVWLGVATRPAGEAAGSVRACIILVRSTQLPITSIMSLLENRGTSYIINHLSVEHGE